MKSGLKRHVLLSVVSMMLMLCTCLVSAQAQYHIPNALESYVGVDGSIWERVTDPGFDSGENFSVVAMAEYQGRLYAMTRNQAEGAEVWRTSDTGWEQVLFPAGETNGIYGNPWINNVWARMIVFQDKLYFGFSSGLQGVFLGSTGCEIWRYDGSTWEPVIADKRVVDDTGTLTSISDCTDGDSMTTAYFFDSGKSWSVDQWAGGIVTIISGTGQYRKFKIISNTDSRLTVQQMEKAGSLTNGVDDGEYTNCEEKTYRNPFPKYSYTLGEVAAGAAYEINIGWEQSGFGTPWNKTITAMVMHDGKLYVSTGLNYKNGAQVWFTEDGDTWQVTKSVRTAAEPYTYSSFGNYHEGQSGYTEGLKPISSSITDLAVSSVSGAAVLYAGGTGTSGPAGGCSRMAQLTDNGWQLIVDSAIDENDTGSNENGFGSPLDCGTNTYNFMPWSVTDFMGELMVGITGEGARIVRAPALVKPQSIRDDEIWFYSVGEGNVAEGYTDPLGTSPYLNGFDGYIFPPKEGWGDLYQNLSVNLFSSGTTLFAGTISQYVPEYGIPVELSDLHGAQIWRSPDGLTWQQVTDNGFDDSETIMFEAFTIFNGTVYVSASKGSSATPSGLGGARVYRLADDDPCALIVEHKTIRSEKLSKDKKVNLKISSDDEDFDIYGVLDLDQLVWQKSKYNEKKSKLKVKALVPSGLEPQVIPISVGECVGEVVIE